MRRYLYASAMVAIVAVLLLSKSFFFLEREQIASPLKINSDSIDDKLKENKSSQEQPVSTGKRLAKENISELSLKKYVSELNEVNKKVIRLKGKSITKYSSEYFELQKLKLRLRTLMKTLLRGYYHKLLINHNDELISLLTPYFKTFKESAVLLAQLKISDELKQELLESKNTPLMAKARLGDKEAFEELINRFIESDNGYRKKILAENIVYVGIEKYPNLFTKALESNKVTVCDQAFQKASDLLYLLSAYQMYNRDINLFNSELNKHVYTTVDEFAEKRHQDYIDKVETYFAEKYNIHFKSKANFLINGSKRHELRPHKKNKIFK